MRRGRWHVGAHAGLQVEHVRTAAKLFAPGDEVAAVSGVEQVARFLADRHDVVGLPDVEALVALDLQDEVVFLVHVERRDRVRRGHEDPAAAVGHARVDAVDARLQVVKHLVDEPAIDVVGLHVEQRHPCLGRRDVGQGFLGRALVRVEHRRVVERGAGVGVVAVRTDAAVLGQARAQLHQRVELQLRVVADAMPHRRDFPGLECRPVHIDQARCGLVHQGVLQQPRIRADPATPVHRARHHNAFAPSLGLEIHGMPLAARDR